MKYLFIFLLLPCCIKAQNNFKVNAVSDCKCYFFVHEIWVISFDSTVTAKLNTKDEFCPTKGDSLYYNGKVWQWHKKQLHLDGVAVFVTRPAPMKAKGHGGNSLVSDDSNHIKVYYQSTDTLPPIACENSINSRIPMLYVVDGVKTHNKEKRDSLIWGKLILSMKVLKDADATALYGKTAANGATIIKTYKK